MTDEFTHGPWVSDGSTISYAGKVLAYATIKTHKKEQIANANLMAAAPELLLILRTAYETHLTGQRDPYGMLKCGDGCWCRNASAIIEIVSPEDNDV